MKCLMLNNWHEILIVEKSKQILSRTPGKHKSCEVAGSYLTNELFFTIITTLTGSHRNDALKAST